MFDAFPELGLKPILPPKVKQPDDGCIRPHPDIYCFLAGDNRVNEQLALGVLHTLAAREHNNIAMELSYINPHWDDEKLYQEARHIMAALVQHITYNEFLPLLLGETYLRRYDLKLNPQGYIYSYDPEVDATIPASFGTAAFRFGHSLLPDTMQRRSPTHKLTGERRLHEMLQQPFDLYKPGWVDAYTLGLVNQVSQPMDQSITSEVTNHLFQEPARDFGRDLAAINLGRAREHGIPGYMAYRKHCGLDDMNSWQDMWSFLPNSTVAEYLKIYDHPDDVDLWSAGVSELPAPGSILGPVFSCIIATTFRDLRKGDRFWYENRGFASSFTMDQLREIKKYTLSRLICNAGDNIETIQLKAMLLPDYDENPRVSCRSGEIPELNLRYWKQTPLGSEDGIKYPEKPHLVNYTNEYPWTIYKDKEPPYYGGGSYGHGGEVEKDPYGTPYVSGSADDKETFTTESQVIYESDIKEQEKLPVVDKHDSLAFMMFSESDKYAIKQDYMYNTSSGGELQSYEPYSETLPVKGDTSYDYPKPDTSFPGPSYDKLPEAEHPPAQPSPVDAYQEPFIAKPSQADYSKYPLLIHESPPPLSPTYPSKNPSDGYSSETSSYNQEEGSKGSEEEYPNKLSGEESSEEFSSEIHFPPQDNLQPPHYEPITESNIRDVYPTKGEDGGYRNKETQQEPTKGYFITTATYDLDKLKDSPSKINPNDAYLIKDVRLSPLENEMYISSKLKNKGSSVSSKPAGFDQIVTDLFNSATNKSDLILDLKDTYNVKTNIITAKKGRKES